MPEAVIVDAIRTPIGRAVKGSLKDIRAAMKSVENSGSGKAGVIGYCWGGSLAWLAATRLNPACAVCYYGGAIVSQAPVGCASFLRK